MTILMITVACAAGFVLGHAHAVWQRHRFIQSLFSDRDTPEYRAFVNDVVGNVL